MKNPNDVNSFKILIFTLIELLVVVAIISILMTILLPALKSARVRSKGLVCVTNLKQVGYSWLNYASDFDAYIPIYYNANENKTWYHKLLQNNYVPTSQAVNGNPSILLCPLQRPHVYTLYGGASYSSTLYGARCEDYYYKLNKIKNASDFAMLLDDRKLVPDQDSFYQWYYFSYNPTTGNAVHLRHFGKANVVFADGSARPSGKSFFDELGWTYIDQPYDN